MKITAIAALAVAVTLPACAMDGRPSPGPGPARACKAGPAQRFLGRPATPQLVAKVRRASGAAVARRITPNMRVTMEFRADRVNVWTSLTDTAERITCG